MTPDERRDIEHALAQLRWVQSIGTVADVRKRVDTAAEMLTWLLAGKLDQERVDLAKATARLRGTE